jgi:hypothetical protein
VVVDLECHNVQLNRVLELLVEGMPPRVGVDFLAGRHQSLVSVGGY